MALYANAQIYGGTAEYPAVTRAGGYSLGYAVAEPVFPSPGYPPYPGTPVYHHDQSFDDRLEYNEDSGFGEDQYRERASLRDVGYREDRAHHDPYRERDREERRGREEGEYRDRERDRDRSRRKDRDRDHRRERRRDHREGEGRDRERRERSRDKGREQRSSPDKFDDDFDDGSKEGRDLRDERGGEKWMTDTPTNTILLRGLPSEIDEKDLHLHIRAELMMLRMPVKDIRLMRRKDTGASRGFAFVEFQSVADSQRWMDQTKGKVVLLNQHSISLYYSSPKTGGEKLADHKADWDCSKCGAHNFKRRDYCFKCSISREESDRTKEGDGFDQVGTNPCNTLIFRGLDALTTEEKLVQAISLAYAATVKNIKIIRDDLTNTSRGYGFAELSSIQEATVLLETLNKLKPIFEVDGKQILVSFAKNTFNTVMTTIGSWSQQAGSWSSSDYYDYSAYSQTYDSSGQYYDYSSYYGRTSTTNSAAAVAQAAIQQAHAAKNYNKPISGTTTDTESPSSSQEELPADYPKYSPPDVSTYQYDETSGYYYDPSTGLYYDASSQYYFNSQSGQFMYWDADMSTYLPAPTQTGGGPDAKLEDPKKEKEKKEKVKIAKKIAKDMEKWAKSLNAQKEAVKEGIKRVIQPLGQQKLERESATADAGFAILEKSSEKTKEDLWLMPPPPMPNKGGKEASKSAALVDYGGDSDSEEEESSNGGNNSASTETKLVDWTKIACLLCKRQFNTKEMLTKHMQLSDLHKQNLEAMMKSKMNAAQMEAFDKGKEGYRDRAKERRQKYGTATPPVPKKKQIPLFEEPVIAEQPTKAGLGQDNIGNKLLQKMGWSMGQGLGKAGQGRVDPIQAQRRVVQAGLGAKGANVTSAPGDTYKDAVKKTMFARYHEVE